MQRRALIADNSAGPQSGAEAVLARFGFVRTIHVPDREHAFARMQDERFDLVVLPLQDVTPGELLALEREIRKASTVSVIGTAPAAETDLIIRAMRAGVHEFLVYPPSAEELAGSVDRLMRRSSEDVQRGELVAVYSGKGGLGSTSVAVNLAHAFASNRTDARVALADLVVSGGDVRIFLNLKPAYDLSDLVAKGSQVDGQLLNSILTACPGGVWALPTGENPEPEEIFDAASIGAILDLLRLHFAMTVADCEHHLSERTLVALDSADTILLITHLSVASLRSTQRTLGLCRRLGYNENKLCVVVNRYQSADVLPIKDAQDLLKWPIYWELPNDYRLSAASLTKGVPVAMEDARSKLARSYQALAAKIAGTSGTSDGLGASPNGKPGSRLRQILGIDRRVGNVT